MLKTLAENRGRVAVFFTVSGECLQTQGLTMSRQPTLLGIQEVYIGGVCDLIRENLIHYEEPLIINTISFRNYPFSAGSLFGVKFDTPKLE